MRMVKLLQCHLSNLFENKVVMELSKHPVPLKKTVTIWAEAVYWSTMNFQKIRKTLEILIGCFSGLLTTYAGRSKTSA